jgi:hypothetical protein
VRIGYDSAFGYNDIPTNAQVVCGYASQDPAFAWPASAWGRFPSSTLVRISTRSSIAGYGIQVLDVETGDATPGQAPGWADQQRRLGQVPTIYCNAATWQAVISAFGNAGIAQPEYWIAAYPGAGPTLPSLGSLTAIGHQYADSSTSGGDYDVSVFADYWPGVDPVPMEVSSDMSNVRSGITVDNVNGHAYAVCSVGSNSSYFADGWLSLATLYGAHGGVAVSINFLQDNGTVIATVPANLGWNTRYDVPLPDGTGIVTVDWTPMTDGTVVVGCLELASR